ncbi:MAG: winged helix DNA-binding protein [Nanoarchaeota archaeon]|nr:winged helix DNA-binding protein [Nanoarchaeota archaeon]
MGAKKKNLYSFFLRKKPVKILVNLAKDGKLRYASVLAKETDCTYSHTVRILNTMKQYGLVEFDKKGRLKAIKLTPLGKEIANHIEKAMRLFKKAEG